MSETEKKRGRPPTSAKTNPADEARAKAAQAARSAILKSTGKKAVGQDRGPQPFVPSGSSCIDDIIGGTLAPDGSGPICPGYPRKRITEIYGAEASGKTTAALQAIAEVQKQGGIAMFLDFEHALHHAYAAAIGVSFDEDKLLLYSPSDLEEGWKMLYLGLRAGVDLVVVDSVASMVLKEEMDKKIDDVARIGALARNMSQMLPKVVNWLDDPTHSSNPKGTALILLNQTRSLIQAGGGRGDNETTAGGKAPKFFAHLRLKFTRIRSESVKKKDKFTGKEKTFQFGNHTQVKVVKSKIDGKAGHTTDIFIRFGHGIDDQFSMIEAGVTNKIIKKSGGYYEFNGQKFQGREKLRAFLVSHPDEFVALRTQVLKAVRTDELPDVTDDDEIQVDFKAIMGDDGESEDMAVTELEVDDVSTDDA